MGNNTVPGLIYPQGVFVAHILGVGADYSQALGPGKYTVIHGIADIAGNDGVALHRHEGVGVPVVKADAEIKAGYLHAVDENIAILIGTVYADGIVPLARLIKIKIHNPPVLLAVEREESPGCRRKLDAGCIGIDTQGVTPLPGP